MRGYDLCGYRIYAYDYRVRKKMRYELVRNIFFRNKDASRYAGTRLPEEFIY